MCRVWSGLEDNVCVLFIEVDSVGMTHQYHQHHEDKGGVIVNGNKPATKF